MPATTIDKTATMTAIRGPNRLRMREVCHASVCAAAPISHVTSPVRTPSAQTSSWPSAVGEALQPHPGVFAIEPANLMFALELDRRSRRAGWGIVSNAAHPGLPKTNLQLSGPSQGKDSPTLLERFYRVSRQVTPFMWREVEEGILPAL
jgi:hypothetical protein